MSSEPLQLRIYPDSVLRNRAVPVDEIGDFEFRLVSAMADLMYRHQGIGLAAPQVGVLQRIVVMDVGEGLQSLINPKIIRYDGEETLAEGCLSLPEIQVEVTRAVWITVSGVLPDDREVRWDLEGVEARVMLHEIDHLDGRLILDYASPVRRVLLKKQLRT